jgi:hypothetical protein
MASDNFVDYVKIHCASGKGGAGSTHFRREKYITKGALKSKMLEFTILNRKYIPLGWSPSQLRAYSLWYIHEVHPT